MRWASAMIWSASVVLPDVDLGDAAAGDAADAERHVELHRAGGDDGDLVERAVLAQTHDGALAELAVDRSNR
jgi:hypothetical protein